MTTPHPPPRPIVVVDPDAALLNALSFALEVEGFLVRPFRSGAEAFAALECADAGCLVIDQNLPDESGLDLLVRLRALGVRAPAVVVTSDAPAALLLRAEAFGASVIEKPLLSDQLFSCIRRLTR